MGGTLAERFRSRKVRVRTAVAAILVIGAGVLLVVVQPWSTTSYDINDSGVWISKDGRIGRVNAQIAEVEVAIERNDTPWIVQDGSDVYLMAKGSGVTQLDAADPEGPSPASADLDGVAELAAGGGVVAAVTEEGVVSVLGVDGSLERGVGEVMKLGAGGKVAVGPDGTVVGYSPSKGRLFRLDPGERKASDQEVAKIGGDVDVAVVGTQGVVLDKEGKRLYVDGGKPTSLDGVAGTPALQRSGPTDGGVLVAGADELVSVDGGDVTTVLDGGSGEPARPVADGRCAYVAWKGKAKAGRAQVQCDGHDSKAIDLRSGGQWAWRSGGPVVALNDASGGAAYVLDGDELAKVADWPDPEQDDQKDTIVQPPPPQPEGTKPPEAVPDDIQSKTAMGARPGKVTYLDVLRNDNDPDGDAVFVYDLQKQAPKGLDVRLAQGGRSVAIDLTHWKKADGDAFSFEYRISDGDSSKDHLSKWAKVDVSVVQPDDNAPPQRIKDQPISFTVEAGKQMDYEVLSAFWDPDGDPIYLAGADAGPGDNDVQADPNGWITFDAGQRTGETQVDLEVKDTRGEAADGAAVRVEITAPGQPLAPVLRSDFVQVRAGHETLIEPLANDADPNDDQLKLSDPIPRHGEKAEGLGAVKVQGDALSVSPTEPGDYTLIYTGSDGRTKGDPIRSTIGIHVYEPTGEEKPVALPDVVEVEPGKTSTVDLLLNDSDPADAVLSVTDLVLPRTEPQPSTSFVRGGVEGDFRQFRVDAGPEAQPTGKGHPPITYQYTVAAGGRTTTSTVTIVVVKPTGNRPPKALPQDPVVVRAGDAARIPIADLAVDPDGDPLSVEITDEPSSGTAASGGDSVRFFAPSKASNDPISIQVEVSEPQGNPQPVTISMLVVDGEENEAPKATPLEARVRSGQTVSIPIPLDDADPDGDAVRIGGIKSASVEGKLTQAPGAQSFTFTANETSVGSEESFEYYLVDARGRQSDPAKVRIGVLPISTEEHAPVAVNDRVTAGDGAEIWVDPTANDTDLDGDVLKLVEAKGFEVGGPCKVTAKDGGLLVTTQKQSCKVPYGVVDVARGDKSGDGKSDPVIGYVTVEVIPGFPGLAPIARDDFAIAGKEDRVSVPILVNDQDPDGPPSGLSAAPVGDADGVSIDKKSGNLLVQLKKEPRLIKYRLTDAQDLQSMAVVRVPSADENRPPVLDASKLPIKVEEDKPIDIDLAKYISDPNGDAMTFAKTVKRGQVDPSGDTGSKLTYTPPKGFTGEVSLVVQVTDDGKPPAASVFTLPLLIEGTNKPPKWLKDPCVAVQQGRDEAVSWSLADAAYDSDRADQGKLKFGATDTSNGDVTIKVSGQSLTAIAGNRAKPGSTVSFGLTVTDGHEGSEPQEQQCTLEVTRYEGPGLEARPTETKVAQGKSVTVDVKPLIANAKEGLSVTAKANGGGTATASGTRVTFTALPTFVGEAIVQYTAVDELSETTPSRKATEQIKIKVLGPPDTPTGVTATQPTDDAIVVSWKNGANHGEQDPSYVVYINGSNPVPCGNPCSLGEGKLRYGQPYTFMVEAKNEIGSSKKAGPSTSITFDHPPKAPTVTAHDPSPTGDPAVSTLTWTWTADKVGTEITAAQYRLDGGGWTNADVNGVTLDLPNRVKEYCIQVQVRNERGWSPASEPSSCIHAYGAPIIDGVELVAGTAGDGSGTVRWSIRDNGSNLTEITIKGVAKCKAVSPPVTVTEIGISGCSRSRDGDSVQLSARNEGGTTNFTSQPAYFLEQPGRPGKPTLTPAFGGVDVTMPDDPTSERPVDTWHARCTTESGCSWNEDARFMTATPYKTVTIEVQACVEDLCSEWSEPASTVPYGIPAGSPQIVSVTRDGDAITVTVSAWENPDPDRISFEVDLDGDGYTESISPGGSATLTDSDLDAGSVYLYRCVSEDGCKQVDEAAYPAGEPAEPPG